MAVMHDKLGNRIVFSSTKEVTRLRSYVHQLLILIGKYMGWEERDLARVFVSDNTCVGDFELQPLEIADLSGKLGFEVTARDYLKDIALRMMPVN